MAFVESSSRKRVPLRYIAFKTQGEQVVMTFKAVTGRAFSINMSREEGKRVADRLYAANLQPRSTTPTAIRRHGSVVFRND